MSRLFNKDDAPRIWRGVACVLFVIPLHGDYLFHSLLFLFFTLLAPVGILSDRSSHQNDVGRNLHVLWSLTK